ncbi:MAG: polyamine ABC transporter substrate-binding protein, partial [Gemmatimonadota bacterium]
IPNRSNLAPRFASPPYDPGNAHSVAYQWGTTGIAYRSDRVRDAPTSWATLWDEAYGGKMTMLDDVREVIGIALKRLGYSLNSTDPAQLAEAKALCIEQKRLLKAYISAPVKAQVIAGDVWIAQLWSGDAFQAQAEEPAIEYVVPEEGSAIWADNLCIPKSAPHKRAAHAWIDYVLRPEVSAAISRKVRYSSPNAAARDRLPDEMRSNPGMYPPDAVMDRLEWQRDLGEATRLWSRIWTEIKAA